MKISDLFEAQDYNKIKEPALRWLAQFTYENKGKNPPVEYLTKLIKKYPNRSGTIYRGLNFYTQQSWQDFFDKFQQGQARLGFSGVSSWSQDLTTAEQFAVTQPTYQLNPQVMTAYGIQQSRKEALSGYRGVILKMHLDAGQAIDVDASGVGHESEIVVPPGTYEVKIDRVIKKYEHQLQDKDTNINQVVLNTTRADLKTSSSEHTFFDYVIHHHVKELSPKAQAHLFSLYAPPKGAQPFVYDVDTSQNYLTKKDHIRFVYRVPSWRLFELASQGAFNSQQIKKIQNLGKQIINQALPVVREYAALATDFDPRLLKFIGKISQDNRIDIAIQQVVSKRVQELNNQVRDINKIQDPQAKSKAIEDYKNELTGLLQRVGASFK